MQVACLELRRLRTRCQKLERGWEQGTVTNERWSRAVQQRNQLFATITRLPISTLEDVVARYEAVAMELIDDDLILDELARRRVVTLRRDLRRLGIE